MKNSYTPQYNEEISFTELYPPLCKRIKIELIDKDIGGDEIIGTTYIDLSQISNTAEAKSGEFLPVFGPCWVHMYGGIRDYGSRSEYVELSQGIREGVAYRGRLLIWLDCTESEPSDIGVVEVEKTEPLPPNTIGKEQVWQLFTTFYEASMIPRKVGGKVVSLPGMGSGREIQFEIAIGEHGFVTQDEKKKAKRERVAAKMAEIIGKPKEEIDQNKIYETEKVYVSSVTPPLSAECSNSDKRNRSPDGDFAICVGEGRSSK